MKVLLLFILSVFLSKCEINNKNNFPNNPQIDTLLYVHQFKNLVEDALKETKMVSTKNNITIEDAIIFVRLYNSIISYGLIDRDPFKTFSKWFDINCQQICDKLDCKMSLGMGYYSDKYKLSIGGMQFPKNSYIIILELQK